MVFFSTLACFLLITLSPISDAYPTCVIGGGISGLVIATRLQQRGYDVELYEQKHRFGGKLDTYRENNSIIEKGPILLTEIDTFTHFWLEAFGMVTINYDVSDHAVLMPNGGVFVIPPLDAQPGITQKVKRLTDIYKYEWLKYPANIWEDFGYSTVDFKRFPELAGSIRDWLEKRGLQELSVFFVWFITILGYGDIRQTPALYALKLISAANADFFFEQGRPGLTVRDGFDLFARRISDGIQKKWSGWELTHIERYQNTQHFGQQFLQTLTFNVDKDSVQRRTCGKTILAFPPLFPKMRNMLTKMTNIERKVLNTVRIKKYAASGLNIPSHKYTDRVLICLQLRPSTLNGSVLPQFEHPPGDGSLLSLTRQDKDGVYSHFSGYSWIAGDYMQIADAENVDMMTEKIKDLMQHVDPEYELYFIKVTEYFPHVSTSAILDGFYDGLNSIQGAGGLYWATTLFTFETVNNAIEMAEKFVATFFPVLQPQ